MDSNNSNDLILPSKKNIKKTWVNLCFAILSTFLLYTPRLFYLAYEGKEHLKPTGIEGPIVILGFIAGFLSCTNLMKHSHFIFKIVATLYFIALIVSSVFLLPGALIFTLIFSGNLISGNAS